MCLGSCQNVSSCPCSTQPLHSLPTCAPALAFPRQAQHSGDSLGILEMPPVEASACGSFLVPRETWGGKRRSLPKGA